MINEIDFKFFLKTVIIITVIQLAFFYITLNNYYFSDDYQSIIGVKLYNLIQGKYTFKDFFVIRGDGHFDPMFYFINQFMPSSHIFFHGIIVFCFIISSTLIYLMSKILK